MKARIEKYLPAAIQAVEKIIRENNDPIPNEYKRYISSFGASVIQAGLLPAVAFYSSKASDSSSVDRTKVMDAILYILQQNETGINKQKLIDFVIDIINANTNIEVWKNKIMDAATALKLAIRTFEITKDK
jgi:CRISPR-associated protein Cmr5